MPVSVWEIVSFVRSKVGCGYVWGARGETCSLSFRQALAKRAPAQAGAILGTSGKWDGLQVFDCASLIREAFKAAGIQKASGATTIWRTWAFSEKGTIATLPANEPGIALFRADSSGAKDKMGHIGLAIGGGLTVDARGSANGVLLGKLSDVKWTHWARFADVNYSAAPPALPALLDALVVTKNGALNIRSRPDTKAQVLGKLPKGMELPVYRDGQTKADWLKVYFAGGHAYAMAQFLNIGAASAPAVPQTPAPAPAPVVRRVLRYSPGLAVMKGEDVRMLQSRLAQGGYVVGAVEGAFGPKTKAATLAFQLDAFPAQPKEWDGIAGPKTWGKLVP